jgi:hypothetical protein
VWSRGSTVPLPDDTMSRLVADHFSPVSGVEASDVQVELDDAVANKESGNGGAQARIKPNSNSRHARVSPDTP